MGRINYILHLEMHIPLFLLLIILYFTACGNGNNQTALRQQLAHKADSIATQRFKTLEFLVDDKRAFATIDTRYKDFKDKSEFPLSLFITVNTLEKDSLGHPVKREAELYNQLEADIIKKMDQQLISAFIGRTTMNGYRDLIFYIKSSDQKKVTDILTGLQKKHTRIKEFIFEEDPEWEAVSDFYNALK